MRGVLLLSAILLTLLATHATSATASDDSRSFSFRSTDKQLHIVTSYALAFTTTEILEANVKLSRVHAVLWASALTVALGTFKELVLDSRYSSGDQFANLIGTSASAAVVFAFEL